MNLKTIATFGLGNRKTGAAAKSFVSLNIAQGSVLDFSVSSGTGDAEKSSSTDDSSSARVGAIVNAANVRCLGGGGVDGAINNAGGPSLWKDREALPVISKEGNRCHIGGAVVTGPGRYGHLHVKYVVHAVGPAYAAFSEGNDEGGSDGNGNKEGNENEEFAKPDALLRSAYQEALERCKEKGVTDVAFSLLSAGIFRGKRSLDEVLSIGVLAIRDWVIEQEKTDPTVPGAGEDENDDSSSTNRLRSVTLCGFSKSEVDTLRKVCQLVFDNDTS